MESCLLYFVFFIMSIAAYSYIFFQHVVKRVQTCYTPIFSAGVPVEEGHAGTLHRHEGRRVHTCRKCGWRFSNPHPSSKQRRSHKKHCGTIEGYAVLIGAAVVLDEDHDDIDKETSPSPNIEKKTSISGSDGGDTGSSHGGSPKITLDKELFYSFNGGTNEVLNALQVTETTSEKLELTLDVSLIVGQDDAIEPTVEGIVSKKVSASMEKEDIGESVKCSEQIKEVMKELSIVLNGKENSDPAEILKFLKDRKLEKIIPKTSGVAPEQMSVYSSSRNSLDGNWGSISGPKMEKKTSFDGSDGFRASISGSEDQLFSDTVTNFSDSGTSQGGSVKESLDKDLFNGEAKKSMPLKKDHAARIYEAANDKERIEDGKKGWKKVKRVRSWLPSLCCSAKQPSAKKTDNAVKKDKAVKDKRGDPMSPPKKMNGDRSWILFTCCSSINVVE